MDDYRKAGRVSSGFPFSLTPYLSCKAAAQVHGTGAGLGCLEPQHDGGGEFVVSSTTAGLLLLAQQMQQAMTILQTKFGSFTRHRFFYDGASPACHWC